MARQSFLSNSDRPLVLDASVAINIGASAFGEQILKALARPVFIPTLTVGEVTFDRKSGRNDAAIMADFVGRELLRVIELDEAGLATFGELTIGRAIDTLDDGEAATIAHAHTHSMIAVIDERKAIDICARRFPAVEFAASTDIFGNARVVSALGEAQVAEALFGALIGARMRVLPEHLAWVSKMIGADRANSCPSLPRFAIDRSGT